MNVPRARNSVLSLSAIFFCLLNAVGISLVFAENEGGNYTLLTRLGSKGMSNGQFTTPHTIAFDSTGSMYITDTKNSNVQKFDSNGTFLTKWGSKGSGEGQFLEPSGIDLDSLNNVYIVDKQTSLVQKFDSNGTFLTKWVQKGVAKVNF